MTITICVTTFNRWKSCFCTLQSVCSQEYVDDIEVILVDDCSTEPMPESVDRFIKNNQIVFIRHENNKGLAAARNSAIKQANGEYFSFCDDDDLWPSDFSYRLLNAVHEAESFTMAIVVCAELQTAWESQLGVNPRLVDVIREGVTPPVGSQIYRTSMIRDIGAYNEKVKSGVDHDLWISLAVINPVVAVSWGLPAIVGNDPHANRMTTIEGRRRKKISASLKIWQPKIVRVFGEDFYKHFCFSYEQYMDYSFFLHGARRGEYFNTSVKIFSCHVMSKVMQRIYRKITGRKRCNLFPSYVRK